MGGKEKGKGEKGEEEREAGGGEKERRESRSYLFGRKTERTQAGGAYTECSSGNAPQIGLSCGSVAMRRYLDRGNFSKKPFNGGPALT